MCEGESKGTAELVTTGQSGENSFLILSIKIFITIYGR